MHRPGRQPLDACEGDFGTRLSTAICGLLARHAGVIIVNSDSPTLPVSVLRAAVKSTRSGDAVVLSPAFDGGYTLIGLSKMHDALFEDIPWSTEGIVTSLGLPATTSGR
jgi:glycosyltransferase A (GT-A) superfamily protein (DUF2064 family)